MGISLASQVASYKCLVGHQFNSLRPDLSGPSISSVQWNPTLSSNIIIYAKYVWTRPGGTSLQGQTTWTWPQCLGYTGYPDPLTDFYLDPADVIDPANPGTIQFTFWGSDSFGTFPTITGPQHPVVLPTAQLNVTELKEGNTYTNAVVVSVPAYAYHCDGAGIGFYMNGLSSHPLISLPGLPAQLPAAGTSWMSNIIVSDDSIISGDRTVSLRITSGGAVSTELLNSSVTLKDSVSIYNWHVGAFDTDGNDLGAAFLQPGHYNPSPGFEVPEGQTQWAEAIGQSLNGYDFQGWFQSSNFSVGELALASQVTTALRIPDFSFPANDLYSFARFSLNTPVVEILSTISPVSDGAGSITGGTVTRTGPTSSALDVAITSSNPALISNVPSVTIPAGASSADFTIFVNNLGISSVTPVTLTASASGYDSGATGVINVNPAESLSFQSDLVATLPNEVVDGQGLISNFGRIDRFGTTGTSVAVDLTSLNPSVLEVVGSPLLFAAGEVSKYFDVIVHDTGLSVNTVVTVECSASGYTPDSHDVTVLKKTSLPSTNTRVKDSRSIGVLYS